MKYVIDLQPKAIHYTKVNSSQAITANDIASKLNEKGNLFKYQRYYWSGSIGLIGYIYYLNLGLIQTILSIGLVLLFTACLYLYVTNKNIELVYKISDRTVLESYIDLQEAIENLTKTEKMWFVDSDMFDPNPKYPSISRYLVKYRNLKICKRKRFKDLSSNLDFYTIKANKNTFIFLPDFLLVKTPKGYISKNYKALKIMPIFYRRVEKLANIPSDTRVMYPLQYKFLPPEIQKEFKKTDELYWIQYRILTFYIVSENIYEQLVFSGRMKEGFFSLGGSGLLVKE